MTNQWNQHGETENVRQAVRRISDDEPTPAVRRVDGGNADDGTTDATANEAATGPLAGDDTEAVVLREVRDCFRSGGVDAPFEAPTEAFLAESFFDFEYLTTGREVARYWVHEPFAYVTILFDESAREYRYHVTEPTLDEFERYVREDLVTLLRHALMYIDIESDDRGGREDVFMTKAAELVRKHAATVDPGTLHKVLYYLRRDFVHYGPIDPTMRDPDVEDISCDGVDVPVFIYHREYRDLRTNVSFGKGALTSFTVRLAQQAGKQLSVSNPLVDVSLPDGSRLQLTMGGDVSTRGANFTIRRFADIPYTPVDLASWGTFSLEQMAYFWLVIENNRSLVFAGGTGSGKTTSMNAVSFFIPPSSKVVTIEDTREIDLPHQNWIQSVTRSSAAGEGHGEVSMYNLLQAALRQRPEYLLVGEIRTEQKVALTFFQAMGTGHTAYTTVHADSIETALNRLQNPPLSVPTGMLQDLDVVSIQRQTFIGDRRVRRNAGVYELGTDPNDPTGIDVETVFEWAPADDTHRKVADSGVLAEIAHDRGWSTDRLDTELEQRERVLAYLLERGETGYRAAAGTIQMYAKDPEYVLAGVADGSLDPSALADHVPMLDGVELPPAEHVAEADERRVWSELTAAAVGEVPDHDDARPDTPETLRTLFGTDTEAGR